MPLDNQEQNEQTEALNWESAPANFRAAHDRNQQRIAELEAQQADVGRLRRENTALHAGIDVASPLGRMFVNSYEGDETPEAMKEAFEALGVPAAPSTEPPPPANDGPTEAEREEQRNRTVVQGTATPPGQEPPGNLTLDMIGDFQENLKKGMRRENAGAKALDIWFEAAMDPNHPQHAQAVWDRERWLASQQ